MADQNAQQKIWEKIVAKAWADEGYKQQLLADPATVLSAEGMALPAGVQIKMVEATDKVAWLVLPAQNAGAVVEGEERLAAIW